MNRLLYALGVVLIACIFSSCRNDMITTSPSAKLSFSTDTLTFDTVFTTIGSATQYFTVHNTNNEKIKISNIHLAGGSGSHFTLNIDGRQGNDAAEIEIPAHDSIYIFVIVTIDPNEQNSPFVIYDSVLFQTNGNDQRVILQAWGQNAHFIYGQIIGTQTWFNDKPYVIIHSILVDSNQTLTVEPGCRIYMHADSYFFVKGTLKVMGQASPGDSVLFRGDRLEQYYVDLPGNWEGIWFLRFSHDNEINYATIKEATVGVRVDSLKVNANPKLIMRNTQIRYTFSSGVIGVTADLNMENCLVQGCGDWDVQLEYGGNYNFQDCTFANYSTIVTNHQKPVLRMSNYYQYGESSNQYYSSTLNAQLTNCIVYGSLDQELDLDNRSGAPYDTLFSHCDVKIKSDFKVDSSNFISCLYNRDPLFVDDYKTDDYHLQKGSPCIDAGIDNGIPIDLDGKPRNGKPDIGCYEFQE